MFGDHTGMMLEQLTILIFFMEIDVWWSYELIPASFLDDLDRIYAGTACNSNFLDGNRCLVIVRTYSSIVPAWFGLNSCWNDAGTAIFLMKIDVSWHAGMMLEQFVILIFLMEIDVWWSYELIPASFQHDLDRIHAGMMQFLFSWWKSMFRDHSPEQSSNIDFHQENKNCKRDFDPNLAGTMLE